MFKDFELAIEVTILRQQPSRLKSSVWLVQKIEVRLKNLNLALEIKILKPKVSSPFLFPPSDAFPKLLKSFLDGKEETEGREFDNFRLESMWMWTSAAAGRADGGQLGQAGGRDAEERIK